MKIGLLGKNISYSKSPNLFKYFSRLYMVDIEFFVFNIDDSAVVDYLNKLRTGEFSAFFITIPYKEKVMTLIDEIDDIASKIGAINFIYLLNGKIRGTNTDYYGFLGMLASNNINVKNKKILIFGTGGAARALNYALINDDVTLVSRTEKGHFLGRKMITFTDELTNYDIYINATPVGTNDSSVELIDTSILKDKIAIDLVYNPKNTAFVRHGKVGISGIDMLIFQGLKGLNILLGTNYKLSALELECLREVL